MTHISYSSIIFTTHIITNDHTVHVCNNSYIPPPLLICNLTVAQSDLLNKLLKTNSLKIIISLSNQSEMHLGRQSRQLS